MKKQYLKMGLYMAVLSLCLSTIFSCADKYGRVGLQWDPEERMNIDMLIENSGHFKVYYSGLSDASPSALLFDPISDDRKIVPQEWWVPVINPEQMKEIVKWLEADPKYPPIPYRIIGQDNKLYGYLYTYVFNVVIKRTEANVLWIDYIPIPKSLEKHSPFR